LAQALKSYNNRPYRRLEEKSALDTLIKRISGEPVNSYPTKSKEKKSFIDKSVQKLAINSIIEGYFPKENLVKEMAVRRINRTLSISIGLLILVAVISYYFVISCEMKLNDISRQTVVLNNENEELQNKLDSLKSFSNVDRTLQQTNMFQQAGKVIETPEVTVNTGEPVAKTNKKKPILKYAIGF